MEGKSVLALPEGLELIGLEQMDGMLVVTVASTQCAPRCPLCGVPARRVHSRYTRCVADLPCWRTAASPLAPGPQMFL